MYIRPFGGALDREMYDLFPLRASLQLMLAPPCPLSLVGVQVAKVLSCLRRGGRGGGAREADLISVVHSVCRLRAWVIPSLQGPRGYQ